MPLSRVLMYEKQAEELGVSKVARGPNGWLTHHKKNPNGIDALRDTYWREKRQGFIARTLVQYQKKPTLRRLLSLIMWSYQP